MFCYKILWPGRQRIYQSTLRVLPRLLASLDPFMWGTSTDVFDCLPIAG
jgi:hypothetical protein